MAIEQQDISKSQLRMMTKIARLYHDRQMKQAEISEVLGISQARVSRLLSAAQDVGIVKTVVVMPDGLNTGLEESLAEKYGLEQVHVVDAIGENEAQLAVDLGSALMSMLQVFPMEVDTVGITSWSRSLQGLSLADSAVSPISAKRVVEMLGGVGSPALQIKATQVTVNLATRAGAEPFFLHVPGVSASQEVGQANLSRDPHSRRTLEALNELDVALVAIGHCEVIAPLVAGENFFTDEQFAEARSLGAVGQVNLRFIDADGAPVNTDFDDLVVGVTHDQLISTPTRIGVAGGPSKYDAIRAALRGQWINTFVTDVATAEHLLSAP